MSTKRNKGNWDLPLLHADHPRPVTRRQFLSQGFMTGAAYTVGGIAPLLNPRNANAALSPDLDALRSPAECNITDGAGKIPFICFDLAGGANIAGSNVLVGGQGGQSDFLSTQGYEKMGLPGDMVPGLSDANGNAFANFDLGLGFHFDSAFRRGILSRVSPTTAANINGAVIPARSDNDTGNNPHNPMYGIALAGAKGSILTLSGSENTDSGGNSMLPQALYDPELRPTKVDRPSDVVNLVDTGDLVGILSKDDATMVMESIYRLSDSKVAEVENLVNRDVDIDRAVRCSYLKAAHIADRFGGTPIDPGADAMIVDDATGIFSSAEFFAGDRDGREFQKTASIMKLVMNGFAGAGCIEMGGYDYHGGARAEGEVKDFRAGQCMGACLEYAALLDKPVMLYVFSDGSLSSNGAIDNSTDGRGKGEWTSDNSSTAGSFFLVYNPPRLGGRPVLRGGTLEEQMQHQQIGYMDAGGSVQRAATPMANNVNLLVNSVILNYMALHGEEGNFDGLYQSLGISHGLGANIDRYIAFQNIVTGTVPA
ncbi:MAG: general secretion pathway protein GspF [Gammaproteobacteria bacterium]|nr:general secretion pathway protein GspF [Gammaproteobacteria bacterium]MDH3480743.1 general secretion pathway protein GspF [Gammaproteobacteria bacterium]